ncbi:hypothetical protein CASFOL_039832 [Castilleja foliolosa]|uniref:SANTA domain-containing protein n=1 Tax=Castilleja foliolosa TaxID=1961234 RepID=A0ABD3BI09_9LAMI
MPAKQTSNVPCVHPMATPTESSIRRKRINKPHSAPPATPNSAPPTTPTSAIRSPFLKQVLLHDWWLIKAGSDSHGKRLGIGGIASKGSQSIRCFSSAHIIKRHDAVTLGTIDGLTISVHGHLNRARTLANGFSHEVCEHFEIGFPYYWEEYGAVSVDEEPTQFPSTPGDQGTNTSSGDIFDDILQKYDGAIHCSLASSAEKIEYNPTTKNVDSISTPDRTLPSHKKTKGEQERRGKGNVGDIERSGGPLTRSRARLLRTNVSGGIC